MFQGSIVAIVTPFKKTKEIDLESFKKLVNFHIDSKTDGIVINGTTGESPNVKDDEIIKLFETANEIRKERKSDIKLIIGTGSNSTEWAVTKSEYFKKLNPDGVLVVTPYYNKPTQEGLYLHFEEVARAAFPVPVILYNVPGRTGCNLLPATIERLEKIENIVSVKEASANLIQMSEIYINTCLKSAKKFTVLSGDDALTLPVLSIGGAGVISVTANIVPGLVKQCIDKYNCGDTVGAREIHNKLLELHNVMFIESNPIPVKTALAMMGMCEEEFRLPLCRISEASRSKLKDILKKYGIVK
ncbi:MAG: 4-hydroxy-tetrahydrodipicolinate synthase [Candidatus Wallbacteria bacterium]